MSAPPVPLAPDPGAGLRRPRLARVREVAPEILQAAKTQRWPPDELLRTLVEAEIAARDAASVRARLRAAGFPATRTLEGFKVAASSVPQATSGCLAGLEWIRAAENVCLVGPAGTGKTVCRDWLGEADTGHRSGQGEAPGHSVATRTPRRWRPAWGACRCSTTAPGGICVDRSRRPCQGDAVVAVRPGPPGGAGTGAASERRAGHAGSRSGASAAARAGTLPGSCRPSRSRAAPARVV